MLGEFLRRRDQSETIANRDQTIEELLNRQAEKDQRLTELEEAQAKSEQAQAKSEQDKETLRNQIRRSGQEPEA